MKDLFIQKKKQKDFILNVLYLEEQQTNSKDNLQMMKKLEELIYKTPSYTAEQEAYQLAHCDDFCAFIGKVAWEQIKDMNIEYVVD